MNVFVTVQLFFALDMQFQCLSADVSLKGKFWNQPGLFFGCHSQRKYHKDQHVTTKSIIIDNNLKCRCICAADELTGIIEHCYMEICVSTWPTLGATIPVQLDAESSLLFSSLAGM